MNKNKQKYMTVTVGIPTFNEENNIQFLLKHLFKQRGIHIKIEKIHIVDDKSTDRTIEQIRGLRDKRIIITQRKRRLGQTSAQNFIFQHASTDVVVILEADTYPAEDNYIDLMVEPFLKNSTIGFVQGNIMLLPARTHIGKVLNKQAEVFTRLVIQNIAFPYPISTGRGGKAFRKFLYKKLRWPMNVPEDDYATLWCIAHNVRRFFQRKAHCYYQRPQTFTDYLKEKQKISRTDSTNKDLFSKHVTDQYFRVPRKTQFALFLTLLKENPFAFFAYGFLTVAERFILRNGKYTDFWPQAQTTKILHTK